MITLTQEYSNYSSSLVLLTKSECSCPFYYSHFGRAFMMTMYAFVLQTCIAEITLVLWWILVEQWRIRKAWSFIVCYFLYSKNRPTPNESLSVRYKYGDSSQSWKRTSFQRSMDRGPKSGGILTTEECFW